MASEIDPIVVQIQGDLNDLKKDLKLATRGIDAMAKSSEKAGDKMGRAFLKATIQVETLKVAFKKSAAVLKGVTTEFIDNTREQTIWARRLQISEKSFSSLARIGARFGADMDTVGDAIKDLNERIADAARGNKTYEDALKMIGLASKDLINLNVDDQFIKVADAIGKMNNAGDQNFATAELMADAGFRMLEVFRLGEDGIRDMTKEIQEMGLALDEDAVKSADKARKELNRMNEALTVLKKNVSTELIPVLADWAEGLQNVWGAAKLTADRMGILGSETKEAAKEVRTMDDTYLDLQRALSTPLDVNKESLPRVIYGLRDLQTTLNDVKKDFTDEEFQNILTSGLTGDTTMESIKMLNALIMKTQAELREFNQEQRGLELQEIEANEKEKTEVMKKEAKAREDLKEKERKMQIGAAKNLFGNLSQLMNSESRKLFEIGKIASIANATVKMYESAVDSFAWGAKIGGPPVGHAFSAAAIAAGLTNIQAISSTSFGGGGIGGGGAAAAGGEGSAVSEAAAPTNVIDAVFNIQSDSGAVSVDQVRGIADGLNELAEDGYNLRTVKVV